jgi:hypothetical protein
MRNVLQINTDGSTLILDLDGAAGSYGTLRTAVGGLIEYVPLPGCEMVVNEEGKYNGSKRNIVATSLFEQAYGAGTDVIMGNVVIVGLTDDEGETTALNPLAIDLLQEGARMIQQRIREALAVWN